MPTIKSLDNIPFETVADTFQEAFGSYDVQINKEELRMMLSRRGYVAALSFGAFEKDKLVAFTLNGVGNFNGHKTAYDTGTGTLKEFQGKGLATSVFNYSIPYLKEKNITHYLLEVLQHNFAAVSVYQKIGFQVTREFNYFRQETDKIKTLLKTLPKEYSIKQTDSIKQRTFQQWHDFIPSWQNSFESIYRLSEDFLIFSAYFRERTIGYCIFEPNTGDITQIAVDKSHRRKGIGTILLQKALSFNKINTVKLINTEISCSSITQFAQANGFPLSGTQFEMIKEL